MAKPISGRVIKAPKLSGFKMPAKIGPTGVARPAQTAPANPFVPQALQPDPLYISQSGVNQAGYENTLAGLASQEQGVRQAYGFDDPSNPFSRAKMLQQAYERRNTTNTNGYAGAGQLYSGALQNAQNESARQNTQDVDTARRQYQSDLDAIAQRRAAAGLALAQGNTDAFGAMIDRQSQTRPAGDPAPAAPTIPLKPAAKKPKKSSARAAGAAVGSLFKKGR